MNIVCENFKNIVNEPSFNELSAQDFTDILNSDKLCVRDEEFIFTAFLKWLFKAENMNLEQMVFGSLDIPTDANISAALSSIKFPLMDQRVNFAYLFSCPITFILHWF